MKKSNGNRFYILKRLFHLQLKSGMSICSYINEFNKLIVDLLNLDETFKDECKAMLLISSHPDGKDKLSFEEF